MEYVGKQTVSFGQKSSGMQYQASPKTPSIGDIQNPSIDFARKIIQDNENNAGKENLFLTKNKRELTSVVNKTSNENKASLKEKIERTQTAVEFIAPNEELGGNILHLINEIEEINPKIIENLSITSALIAHTSIAGGLSLLTQGLEALSYVEKIPEYQKQGEELTEKEESLTQLNLQRNLIVDDKEEIVALNKKIKFLTIEIEELVQKRQELITDTITNVLINTIGNAKTAIGIAKLICHHESHAAEILKLLGPSIGLASGVVGTVLSGTALINDINVDAVVTEKFNELVRLLKETQPGDLMDTIIRAKLRQLDQQSSDLDASMLHNYVSVISSTLSVGASVGGIVIGAGVAVGVVGSAIISGTGIGALVLASGVLACGSGYMFYKHRETIANGLETVGNVAEQEVRDMQLQNVESQLLELDAKIKMRGQILLNIEAGEKRFSLYHDKKREELKSLGKEVSTLKSQLPNVEQLSSGSLFDRASAYLKKIDIEGEINERDAKMVEIGERLREVRDFEDSLVTNAQKKISKYLLVKEKMVFSSSELKERVQVLGSEKEELKKKGNYITIANKMKGMDWKAVLELKNKLQDMINDSLLKEITALEPIKEFLTKQNFDWEKENFASDPAHVLLQYITREEVAI